MKTRIHQLIRISTPVMAKRAFAALVALTITASAFAKDVTRNISYKTMDHFKSAYSEASDVQWTLKNDFVKASFLLEGERVEAFYSLQGELIGSSKAISSQSLPAAAQRLINKKYDKYTVKEVIQFDGAEATKFYVSLDGSKKQVVLEVNQDGATSVFRTTKK